MVAGVVSAVGVLFVSGLVHIERPIAYPVAIVVGLAVFLVLRARRRAADRRAGRDPDEVAKARSDATAAANHGRRFFIAQNPVVLIVMGAIFLTLAVVSPRSVRRPRVGSWSQRCWPRVGCSSSSREPARSCSADATEPNASEAVRVSPPG